MLQKWNHSPSRRWTWCNLHPTEFSVFRPSLIESLISWRKTDWGWSLGTRILSLEIFLQSSVTRLWFHHEPSTGSAAAPLTSGWGFVLEEKAWPQSQAVSWATMSFMCMAVLLSGRSPWKCGGVCLVELSERWDPLPVAFPREAELLEWAEDGHCLRFSVPVWMFSPGTGGFCLPRTWEGRFWCFRLLFPLEIPFASQDLCVGANKLLWKGDPLWLVGSGGSCSFVDA